MTDRAAPLFPFDNTYARELEGFYARVSPGPFPSPSLVLFNDALAAELGLEVSAVREQAAELLSGHRVPEGADPLAQAYAGHQFGGLSPQLGDGRALLLGELVDIHGQRRDVHLKGSGRTPFSRRGDGLSALAPVLREYVMGEAMHHLGVPTTRALAAIRTGATVRREGSQPGGVLARVAASHIRVGTFQFFAIRDDEPKLRQLVRYTLARHYPDQLEAGNPALALLRAAVDAQARLIAKWMQVGFIHGVMNTDNMTLSGETIDYGPCAFMDAYAPGTVFSSIDERGRYAYGNQPGIGQWNLARLAESLLPLLHPDEAQAIEMAQEALAVYPLSYGQAWLSGMRCKLGLSEGGEAAALEGARGSSPSRANDEEDAALVESFLALLEAQQVDFTNAFRSLARVLGGGRAGLATARALYREPAAFDAWARGWEERLARAGLGPLAAESPGPRQVERAASMDAVNPLYVPRNHKVEEALAAAVAGELAPIEALIGVLARPFEERAGLEAFAQPAPLAFTETYQTFCGT